MERVNMAFVPQLALNRKVETNSKNKINWYWAESSNLTTLFFLLDRQPLLHSKVEDDKGFDGENGSVVFYDEIPLILEHPK